MGIRREGNTLCLDFSTSFCDLETTERSFNSVLALLMIP